VVRLACKDRGNARVRLRAALLRACAVAALAVQPALAAPNHQNQSEFTGANALADHGPPTSTPGRAGVNGNGPPPALGDPGAGPPPITANSGTFDVAVAPRAEADPGHSGDSNANKPDLPPQLTALPI
jgi:hypothetical protein